MSRLSLRRPVTSYSKVQKLVGDLIRSRHIQLRRVDRSKSYLNVGCGAETHPDFINLDYTWNPSLDLCWDITRGLPLPDASMQGIFTEHCLEHVTYDQCVEVLREFKRVLRKRGVLRVVLPDAGLYLDLYQKRRQGLDVEFPYVGVVGERDLEEDSRVAFTPMMAVNRIFRGYGHLFAYDAETLCAMLEHCGFREVERCEFMKGRDQRLLIDSDVRRPQSLYVEAVT
jgi:predicted SAM-dependent methyltransferase